MGGGRGWGGDWEGKVRVCVCKHERPWGRCPGRVREVDTPALYRGAPVGTLRRGGGVLKRGAHPPNRGSSETITLAMEWGHDCMRVKAKVLVLPVPRLIYAPSAGHQTSTWCDRVRRGGGGIGGAGGKVHGGWGQQALHECTKSVRTNSG